MGVSDHVDEFRFVLDRGDPLQFRLEGIESLGVGGLLVHAGTVVVADLLVDGAAVRASCRCFFEDATQGHEIALVDFREANPLGLVSGDLRVLEPVAAGVLVEIDARVDRLGDRLDAEAIGHLLLRSLREGGDGRQKDNNEADDVEFSHNHLEGKQRIVGAVLLDGQGPGR